MKKAVNGYCILEEGDGIFNKNYGLAIIYSSLKEAKEECLGGEYIAKIALKVIGGVRTKRESFE